jgi:hypothetical protein
VLQISSNLNLALHHLVSPGDSRYLWIDQICINQNDDSDEKATQIKLMHLIYSSAENVAVWLGEAPEGMDLALDSIPSIQNALNTIDGPLGATQANFESHNLPAFSSPVWHTLGAIFTSSWFERLWTLQEVVLARRLKFQMGSYFLDWDSLSSFVLRIAKAGLSFHMRGEIVRPKDHADGFTAVQHILYMRQAKAQLGSVLWTMLLEVARTRTCTLKVDRIYAITGLLSKELRDCIPIDYESSTVFLDCFKIFIQFDITHYLLNSASSRNNVLGLPSWCPNICQPSAAHSLGVVALTCGYRAGCRTFPTRSSSIQVLSNSDNILVQGLRIDTVASVVSSEPPWLGSADPNIACQVLDWEAECLKVAQEVFDMPNGVPKEHWCTLIAGKMHKTMPCGSDHIDSYYNMKRVWGLIANRAMTFPEVASGGVSTLTFMEAVTFACSGRRYFSTKNGRVGLGPADIEPGDLVCVFLSGPTPYIIRQSQRNSNYKFLGESYVHGLMNSEALDMMDQGVVQSETFELE